ncbi:Sodium/hydrogen exchanger [Leucogyrophana mollusca]|uniref:Sodium/hydrogen exchanger n=1 Tax=Leucogyrophana mollusca TaxID=85980 RepID=A0ACB8BRX2_9AGAM|nr:Sodium/hydrogen exchanger [Leucogyrophana mollusca]
MDSNLDLWHVSDPGLAYICLGGFIVLFSVVSLLLKEKFYINEVVLGTAFGVLMGPYVAGIFDPRSWGSAENTITLEVMRVVLGIGLFAAGVELPSRYMKEHLKGLLIMVVPTMAIGWFVVASVIYGLFPSLNFISALCIAACLTPTDPVTCAAITRGTFSKAYVREEIRDILSAEAAANDGLAYPFLTISIYLTVERSTSVAIGKWFLVGWLYQVILGTVLGSLLGVIFSKLMKVSHRQGFNDRESYVAQFFALSVFTIGVTSTVGADDLLAAFAAGCAISWDGDFKAHTEGDTFTTIIDYILNCACFIYIGAWLPFSSYESPTLGITPGRLVVLLISILVLRRIPPLFLLYKFVPELDTWRDGLFAGHFGPVLFVSSLAITRLPVPQIPPTDQAEFLAATLQTIVSFIVLGSIVVHGLSIPLISVWYRLRSQKFRLAHEMPLAHLSPGAGGPMP